MNLIVLAKVLWQREQLRQHDGWSRSQLEAHQSRELKVLRDYALERSPFYQRFHKGLEGAALSELPVLTKADVMANFDEFVTDRSLKLQHLETYLAGPNNTERFEGRYWVSATSGSTGRRGIFVSSLNEWATVLASYSRAYAWGGVHAGLTRRTKMAVVSSRTPWHQSARVGASVQSPFIPTLRLDATESLEHNVTLLNAFQPEALVAYASMAHELAIEQLEGRLKIAPRAVFTASEVLTEDMRQRIADAWGQQPFNVYASTETAGIASECDHHAGMHLYEDLVITEVVDEHNQAVPAGQYGEKLLVTVLFSRTQPLIRYEMSDSLRLTTRTCASGKPFALVDGIQGRREDVLRLPALAGGMLEVHPNVFHRVMERTPVGEWQIVQESDGLRVLVVKPGAGFADDALAEAIRAELTVQGVMVPPISVKRVSRIPKTALGKTPLIKAALSRAL